MIKSFRHKGLERLFIDGTKKGVQPQHAEKLADILDRLDAAAVECRFTGGSRGWAGDVPVVRLDCRRIRDLGWRCRLGSRQAVRLSLKALVEDARIAGG